MRHRFLAALIAGLCVTSLCALPSRLEARQAPPAATQAPAPPALVLRVFLDCDFCDFEYMRQNVDFVEYVRDRAVADLHVLVTTQSTGSGGRSWTMQVIGLSRFQSVDRTFSFTTAQSATSDDQRKEFLRVFKIGISGYVADTAAGRDLEVSWKPPAAPAAVKKDPWHLWVFRTNFNTNINGEASSKSRSYRGGFSANRVTPEWKVSFSTNGNDNRSDYTLSDDRVIVSRSNSWSTNGLVVKSLGPKWSLAASGSVSHSSFSNTDLQQSFSAGLEFDFFPYSESARRSLTVQYTAGASRYKYAEMTVFDKLKETAPKQKLNVSLGLRQPWGSLNAESQFSQQLSHLDRYQASVEGGADVRLFKGFSFNVYASYSRIKDQISLRKGEVSTEELLLRLQQLSTDYSYYYSIGFSYSFGSIFNSVVNPRFGGQNFFFFF